MGHIGRCRRKVTGGCHAQRLHDAEAVARLQLGAALRALVSVQLQPVRSHAGDNGIHKCIVRIDGEHDDFRLAPCPLCKAGRRLQRNVARALWKEDEADHVGPRFQRGAKRLFGRQTADLDEAPALPCLPPFSRHVVGGDGRHVDDVAVLGADGQDLHRLVEADEKGGRSPSSRRAPAASLSRSRPSGTPA